MQDRISPLPLDRTNDRLECGTMASRYDCALTQGPMNLGCLSTYRERTLHDLKKPQAPRDFPLSPPSPTHF